MKKLFLLDAMALIYRAHFAFAKTPRITSKGLNTSAVFGFANTLLDVLQKEKPTHLGVAFDTPKPTFRHEQYVEYKAQRQEQPEDITVAIPYVIRLCQAMNIPILMLDGYEADDVIGTIAKAAARTNEFDVYMMTPDKDYGQLVEEHIFMYKPAFMGKDIEVLGVQQVLDKWGINQISQVIDMLGLMGDAVDNIPGIPGVGEKTAQKLVQEYGSVENLIANVDQLKGKLQENVRNFAQQGMLSKELATIFTEVPVPFDEQALLYEAPNREVLSQLLDELEFRTLRRRLLGDEPTTTSAPPQHEGVATKAPSPSKKSTEATGQMDLFASLSPEKPLVTGSYDDTDTENTYAESSSKDTVNTVVHRYHCVDTPELRQSLVHYLSLQQRFCFDTETTSTDTFEAELVGLAFAYLPHEAFYIPIPADQNEAKAIVQEFKTVLENPNIEKIAHNLKFDLMVLQNYGIAVAEPCYDTMLAHYLVEPEGQHKMDRMAEKYLNYSPIPIEELIGKKGKNQGNMRDVAIPEITEYAAEDADITLQLRAILQAELAQSNAEKLFQTVEMPLVHVLADMEIKGVRIDVPALKELSETLATDIQQTEQQIFELAGQRFNIASPKQLGEILFEKLKLDKNAKKTKTGQYATGEEILSKLESEFEIARKILDFRELQKLKSTYIDALPLLISPKTGRIHTSYNQAVAATGRLSSTNPNLQNIPIRTPRGREIRKAFVPQNDDFVILSADYSQIELRIMAAFSQDESMMEAFNRGIDIHSTTASKVFNVSLDQVTSDMRRKAKMVNFGIIYGISAFGLAQRLEIPRAEAKEIIDNYFKEFPRIKQYMDSAIVEAREREYVETIMGRRRYLRDINSRNMTERNFAERNAINAPIQGSAADMIKIAMIRIHDFLKKEKLKSSMILTVHDELVFDAHYSEIELLKERVNDLMVHALPLAVRMETGMGTGKNWLEAH
ncbi:MAG: DNA polymerase I [Spirosomataceae bacterium]